MSEKNNKIKYNLKNAHYALLTSAEDGTVSYGDLKSIPGSVSISKNIAFVMAKHADASI